MANIKQLKQMIKEPASKEWFAKYGLPKSIKNHPLKKKMVSKMTSHGELAKAEKGEKQHTGKMSKQEYESKNPHRSETFKDLRLL